MISYAEIVSQKELAGLPQNSIKTRILAIFDAYGSGFDFLDFWLQKNEGKTTAALCRFSGELWLLAGDDADAEELESFCRVIAPTVLTDSNTAAKLGLERASEFCELSKRTTGNGQKEQADILKLYDLLMQGSDGDIDIPDKNEWYADISHRIRHGAALATVGENSAALAGFVACDSALVTGVAVKPDARAKGEGRAAVCRLCTMLSGKTIYAEANDNTAEFYIKCGFKMSSRLVRCKTK